MTIPKRLHRIWNGPPMPEEFQRYGRQWRELHPAWECTDWTDLLDSSSALLARQAIARAPMRDRFRWIADVARLAVLFVHGGVYVDTDIEPLRAIDDLVDAWPDTVLLATSANRGPGGVRVVSNAFLAAPREHPFVGFAIESLARSIATHAGKPTAQVVGPWHLQRCLDEWDGGGVTVLPERTFYPQSNADRDAGRPVDLARSYGWHRWATSRDAAARG